MKIEIRNRWSGEVVYTSEQPAAIGVRRARGNAILEALKNKTDLSGSNLSGSDLSGSDLRGSFGIYIPKIEKPHQKILAAIEAGGVFDMHSVHWRTSSGWRRWKQQVREQSGG